MRQIEILLNEYGHSHTNKFNILIHAVAVPAIYFVTLGLVWSIPRPEVLVHFDVAWACALPRLSHITLNQSEKRGEAINTECSCV